MSKIKPAAAQTNTPPESSTLPGPLTPLVSGAGPEASANTHRIAGLPERGFYRAGHHWPREGVEVARSKFDDEQWVALENEPRLTIDRL